MDNPKRTYGLFTENKNQLNEDEKKELKGLYEKAQENNSIMWQTVVSFDMEHLKEAGLIEDERLDLYEDKLKEYTRNMMSVMKEQEKMDNAVWSASVHKNTEHIHIHIAMVEPEPSNKVGFGRCSKAKDGTIYQRGKMEQGTIDACKRKFAGQIRGEEEKNLSVVKITETERDIIAMRKNIKMRQDKTFKKGIEAFIDTLPEDMSLWQYGKNAMKDYRDSIDNYTSSFLDRYCDNEFQEWKGLVENEDKIHKTFYGEGKRDYVDNKIKDIYKRLGQKFLDEMKEYKKEQRQEHISKTEQNINQFKGDYNMNKAIFAMKKILRKDIQNMKNQSAYERLRQEEEMSS